MAKLHELLAIDADLKGIFTKIMAETMVTFKKREDHFKAFIRTLEWFDSEMPKAPDERKTLDTTVQEKLDYQQKHVVRFFDAVLQKETTNQIAKADIVIGDQTIATDVPAGFLLGLEKLLKYLRSVYETIPTLPPGIDWIPDPETGENVYKRKFPKEEYRTEKTIVPQIMYEATKEHPAQVDKISETKNIGKYTRNEWCSMITPAEKSKFISRIDSLSFAVKKSRQRANNTKVVKVTIGEALFNYINE